MTSRPAPAGAASATDGTGRASGTTGVGRTRQVAGWTAVAASGIYVALKVLWICGSGIGIDDLGDISRTRWVLDNALTGTLGVIGMIVGLATVRPWGTRLPVWLLGVPMWVGAGLLAPFVVVLPASGIFFALGWWAPTSPAADSTQPLLQPWIFLIVYGSFLVLGVALAIALALYARDRFAVLVRGTVAEGEVGATHGVQVPLAWLAGVLAAGLVILRLYWALGGTAGLVVEPRAGWLRFGDTVTAFQVALAAAGLLGMVHRWPARGRFVVPLVAVWLGGGGMVGAGFLAMPTILSGDRWAPQGQTFAVHAYGTFGTVLLGSLVSVLTVVILAERKATLGVDP
ncbi:hypothetical protein [Plantactinospora soyae]|uniref:Uncharacterized protein n=1 Tax=Plantactinospora soyae TaxID=1544732 RepID=A0A927MB86_9ACTN|nr:hypothetical protein [Plantactinospora soyae]MBE1491304.1 hypothetical protein [Plantactinospora soyae]